MHLEADSQGCNLRQAIVEKCDNAVSERAGFNNRTYGYDCSYLKVWPHGDKNCCQGLLLDMIIPARHRLGVTTTGMGVLSKKLYSADPNLSHAGTVSGGVHAVAEFCKELRHAKAPGML